MPNALGDHIDWSVLWYVPTKGQIIDKWCGNDLTEALRIYMLAKSAGKKLVTLRSNNVGFPPPEKYRVTEMVNMGSQKEPRWLKVLPLMQKANDKGIFWCPYCREFRKFQKQLSFLYDGRVIRDPNDKGGLYCPMCGISHRDFHARRWNPRCANLYERTTKRRKSSGNRSTGTTRRRSRQSKRAG